MYDYGRPYRQTFLEQDAYEKRQSKQLNWILFLGSVYIGGHVVWYLMRAI